LLIKAAIHVEAPAPRNVFTKAKAVAGAIAGSGSSFLDDNMRHAANEVWSVT